MSVMSSLHIRTMRETDLTFAAECTKGEGWVSENYATMEGFFLRDPQGCLIAEQDGMPVGICIATFYGRCGFIGELIVQPDARGKGVGARLLNHGVQALMDRGVATVYLDGVVKAVDLYERNGFHKVCRSWRFSGRLAGKSSPFVRHMTAEDLPQVNALDERAFGADRSFFLQRRLRLFPQQSYVLLACEKVTGYLLGRKGEGWVSAGPWVSSEEARDPLDLLYAFGLQAGGNTISIGILDVNQRACELVRSLSFVEHIDSPWRMALGYPDGLGTSPLCYAVGSAAKG